MRISIIVAKSDNHVIGVDNSLPWHLPEDLKRFRDITMGHPMIMGRLTYESIGRPLPGRKTIVLSSQSLDLPAGVECASSPDQALDIAKQAAGAMTVDTVMVVGGAQVYKVFMPMASRLYVTEVHTFVAGDTYLPEIQKSDWMELERSKRHSGDTAYSFVEYQRKSNA